MFQSTLWHYNTLFYSSFTHRKKWVPLPLSFLAEKKGGIFFVPRNKFLGYKDLSYFLVTFLKQSESGHLILWLERCKRCILLKCQPATPFFLRIGYPWNNKTVHGFLRHYSLNLCWMKLQGGSMRLHATQQNRNPFRESNLAELVSNLSRNQMEMFYIFKIDRRDSLVKSCRF